MGKAVVVRREMGENSYIVDVDDWAGWVDG